jgi:hypothetical protein
MHRVTCNTEKGLLLLSDYSNGTVVDQILLGDIRKEVLNNIRHQDMDMDEALKSCERYRDLANVDKVVLRSNIKLILSL